MNVFVSTITDTDKGFRLFMIQENISILHHIVQLSRKHI